MRVSVINVIGGYRFSKVGEKCQIEERNRKYENFVRFGKYFGKNKLFV